MKLNKREKGFSLIELLIVVAIILIIAAIAIPNLLRAKIAANQSSAAASLRTLGSASVMYSTTYGNGFPNTMAVLAAPAAGVNPSCTAAGLIDSNLSSGQKSGYSFGLTPGTIDVATPACTPTGQIDMFTFSAIPVTASTGTVAYCIDGTNVIRQDPTGKGVTVAAATGCDSKATALGN